MNDNKISWRSFKCIGFSLKNSITVDKILFSAYIHLLEFQGLRYESHALDLKHIMQNLQSLIHCYLNRQRRAAF